MLYQLHESNYSITENEQMLKEGIMNHLKVQSHQVLWLIKDSYNKAVPAEIWKSMTQYLCKWYKKPTKDTTLLVLYFAGIFHIINYGNM